MTLVDLGVIGYFVLLVATAWWANHANKQWLRRVTERGLTPEYAPGGLRELSETSARASLSYLLQGPLLGLRDARLKSVPDADPETESWRLRSRNRMQLLVVVGVCAWALPTAAAVLPPWLDLLPDMPPSLRLAILAIMLTILGAQSLRLVRSVLAYGNAETLGIRKLVLDAIGVAAVLFVVSIPVLVNRLS